MFICGRIAGIALFLGLSCLPASGEELVPVGVAKLDITPDYPIRLSGYSARRQPSEGVAQRVWVRALAIGGDTGDGPAVLLTVDTCGVPGALAERVREKVKNVHVRGPRIAICSSHSHTAPWLVGFAPFLAQDVVPAEQQRLRQRYTSQVEQWMVAVVREALDHRQPATLSWGQGSVGFAANRRVLKDGKWAGFGVQADGPVDHRLPVLVAKDAAGKPIAIWTNYACHCTTLGGDFNQICGDWSGYAQASIEAEFPGATSLISIGCGADANPDPRGKLEFAEQHGRALAREIRRVLAGPLTALPNTVSCQLTRVKLPFGPIPDRAAWEATAASGGSKGFYGRHFLGMLERGETIPTTLDYPVSAWTFGDKLAVVFLGGEVVVDYSARMRKEFDAERMWVTAYANDVPCYIASRRILREGGYEADSSMIYYGRPTRLSPQAEDVILQTVHQLLPEGFANAP